MLNQLWKYLSVLIFGNLFACTSNQSKDPTEELADKAYRAQQSGNYQLSINYYDQLITEDSLNGHFYYGRASAKGHLGLMKEASIDYLRSAELRYRRVDSYYNAGLTRTYTDDSMAIIYFRKAMDLLPLEAEDDLSKIEIQFEIDECRTRLRKNTSQVLK